MGSTTPAPAVPARQVERGEQRRESILQVATQLFLEQGYLSTSMDQIVHRLGGSKGTLYTYFSSKADLFRAVVRSVVADNAEPGLELDGSVEQTLEALARTRLEIISSQRHLALLRLVIAEQKRFPDIAEVYWEEGPETRRRVLAECLAQLARGGALSIDDPLDAADTLIALLIQTWYMRQLCVPVDAPAPEALHEHASSAVRKFLTLYGAAQAHG